MLKNESKSPKNRRLRRANPFRNSRETPKIFFFFAPQDRTIWWLSASRTKGQGDKLHWTSRISSKVHFSEQLSLLHCYYSTNCILLVGISLFTTSRSDILEEVLGFWSQGPRGSGTGIVEPLQLVEPCCQCAQHIWSLCCGLTVFFNFGRIFSPS